MKNDGRNLCAHNSIAILLNTWNVSIFNIIYSHNHEKRHSTAKVNAIVLMFVYRIHDPKGLSILTQLRVGLSKLNFHKFKCNFRETLNPLCAIKDGAEETEHYFLLCHAYDAFRRDLLSSVNAILLPHGIIRLSNEELLKIILYGHEQLSLDSNAKILRATVEFPNVLNDSVT